MGARYQVTVHARSKRDCGRSFETDDFNVVLLELSLNERQFDGARRITIEVRP